MSETRDWVRSIGGPYDGQDVPMDGPCFYVALSAPVEMRQLTMEGVVPFPKIRRGYYERYAGTRHAIWMRER